MLQCCVQTSVAEILIQLKIKNGTIGKIHINVQLLYSSLESEVVYILVCAKTIGRTLQTRTIPDYRPSCMYCNG